MKIISDIITELVEADKSLMTPLLKTKVLATKINQRDLLAWVNSEIDGYSLDDNNIPSYRQLNCGLVCNYVNGNMQYRNQPLPISALGGTDIAKLFNKMTFHQSISTLQSFLADKKKGSTLDLALAPEIVGMVSKRIRDAGNRFFSMINASQSVPLDEVNQIVSSIRSKLLEFMLEVDKEFGNVVDINDFAKKIDLNKRVTTIMKKTIIKAGDNAVVTYGNKNKVKATQNLRKGNLSDLKALLKKKGIADPDVNELENLIKVEQPSNGNLGPRVNKWIQKMVGKAIDGSWQIGAGTAAGMLTEVIAKYYGIG